MTRTSWTDAQIKTLKGMRTAGARPAEVAEATGKTTQAVYAKAQELGIAWGKKQAGGRHVPEQDEPEMQDVPPPKYNSLTAFLMRDPPIGRSALDQKGGRV